MSPLCSLYASLRPFLCLSLRRPKTPCDAPSSSSITKVGTSSSPHNSGNPPYRKGAFPSWGCLSLPIFEKGGVSRTARGARVSECCVL